MEKLNVIQSLLPFYILHPRENIFYHKDVYVDMWTVFNNNTGLKEYFISYYLYFSNNGEISSCPCIFSSTHKDDVEHITINYNPHTLRINYIYYFAHGSQGTKLYSYDVPTLYNTNRPVVYIALNSHASYPTPGTKWRMLGLANDVCATDEHNIFNPHNFVIIGDQNDPIVKLIKSNAYYRKIPDRTFSNIDRLFFIWR